MSWTCFIVHFKKYYVHSYLTGVWTDPYKRQGPFLAINKDRECSDHCNPWPKTFSRSTNVCEHQQVFFDWSFLLSPYQGASWLSVLPQVQPAFPPCAKCIPPTEEVPFCIVALKQMHHFLLSGILWKNGYVCQSNRPQNWCRATKLISSDSITSLVDLITLLTQ